MSPRCATGRSVVAIDRRSAAHRAWRHHRAHARVGRIEATAAVERYRRILAEEWAAAEHGARVEAERLAHRDQATGLLNLPGLLARWGEPGAVLLLDLDRFKQINDSYGHDAGNQVVAVVADRLSRCGLAARLTRGDEFAVLVPSADGVRGFAAWLAGAIAAPIQVDLFGGRRTEVVVTASIGIAPADGDADPDELLRRADLAMYHAKYHRRSPVVWTTGMGMPESASIGARGAAA